MSTSRLFLTASEKINWLVKAFLWQRYNLLWQQYHVRVVGNLWFINLQRISVVHLVHTTWPSCISSSYYTNVMAFLYLLFLFFLFWCNRYILEMEKVESHWLDILQQLIYRPSHILRHPRLDASSWIFFKVGLKNSRTGKFIFDLLFSLLLSYHLFYFGNVFTSGICYW